MFSGLQIPARRAVVLATVLLAFPAGAEESDGLERLKDYLAGFTALRAEFTQEVVDRDLELVESASGSVALQKPGQFRWNYEYPFERLIVADGQRVWLYEADLEQVTIRRLDAGIGETPAALLTGDVDALDQFEFIGASSGDGIDWLRLRPRSSESDFERIGLGFDGEVLVQIALDDRLGQRTRIVLTDVERPASIPDAEFSFVPPEGVDVIGEAEL